MPRDLDLGDMRPPRGTELPMEVAGLKAQIHRLEQELVTAKRLKRALDAEVVELRSHLREADLKLGAGLSGYYRLGRILVEGFTSWRGLLHLAPRLYTLARDEWRGRPKATPKANSIEFGPTPARDGSMIAQLHLRVRTTGHEAAAAWVLGLSKTTPALKARLLMEIARLCRHTDTAAAIELSRKALGLDKTPVHLQWLAFALYDAGAVFEPAQLLRELRKQNTPMIGVQAGLAERILAREALLTTKLEALPEAISAQPGRSFLIFADHVLPLRWSLSACRLHILALTLQRQGCDVIIACPSRPGSAQPRAGHAYATDGVNYTVLEGTADQPILRWLNGSQTMDLDIAFETHGITNILTTSRLSVAVQALRLAQLHNCQCVVDDEGDESFTAPGGISASTTEYVQLTRQLKQDILIAAHKVISPWNLTPLPPESASSSNNLRGHSILHGRRVIGFVGEQSPEYNLMLLPTMYHQVAEALGNRAKIALLLSGVGRAIDLVEDQLVERGWDHDVLVLHRPEAASLAGIYRSMDIFAAPVVDDANALDRPPVEVILAIRFGIPVVASDCATAQSWKAAGLPVIIAARGDAASLAASVLRVLMNPQAMADARRAVSAWNAAHTITLLDSEP